MKAQAPSVAEAIERYARLLWQPGDIREVRIPNTGRYGKDTASGYFDDPSLVAPAVEPFDGKANIYITINPVDAALLARAANRIRSGARETTGDAYVLRRAWLPVDVDAVRPPGVSSSEIELAATLEAARDIATYLLDQGWRLPITSTSGNGYQLLYPVDLPNDAGSTALVKGILEHLAAMFGNDVVKVDTSVHNASMIMALVGTMKVKGDDTPDRPHRCSALVHVPDALEPVPLERLSALAPASDPSRTITIGGDGIAPGWVSRSLDEAGIVYREQPADGQGRVWYHVERCPWHPDDGAWECGPGEAPGGKAYFHGFHDRCTGKGWQDFKAALGLRMPADGPTFTAGTSPVDDADWTEIPLPRSLTEYPPPLSEHALVGIVGEVARETVALTGCDPLSPVIHLLALWGAAAPANVREAHLNQPAREYVLPVGRTGRSRKGTVHAAIVRLIRYVDTGFGERVINWQGGSGEGLFTRLASDENERRCVLFADEFGQILAQAQRTGQTVLPAIRSLWNPEGAADIPTRRDPVHVEGIHLAGVFHTTAEEVQGGFRTGEITTGLVNRLLVARLREAEYRRTSGEYESRVFERLTKGLAESVEAMAKLRPDADSDVIVIGYSPEATKLWDAIKPDLETQDGPGGDILARGAGHLARMALLYALLAGRHEIEAVDLRAAAAVWSACRHSALLLFGALTGDRDADRIYAILCQLGGAISRTDLRDAMGRHGRRDDIEPALILLATRGLIRRSQRRTGGKPVERIEVCDLAAGGRDLGDISDISDRSPSAPDLSSLSSLSSQGSRQHTDDGWDPGTATYDDASPVCEVCGHTKVTIPGLGRWVCTSAPGHAKPSTTPMMPEAQA